MSVHEKMEALADLLIAGGLSQDERAEAERHAAECAACGTLIRDAREFSAWTKGLIQPDAPPADLEDRVIARFRAAGQVTKRRFIVGKRVLKVTGSIAAAVALIFLGNLFSAQGGVASSGEVFRQTAQGVTGLQEKGSADDQLRSYWSKMDAEGTPAEDSKAREIRKAYEEQLGRDKQEVTLAGRTTEGEKAVDEFRRQTGWTFAFDQKNQAQRQEVLKTVDDRRAQQDRSKPERKVSEIVKSNKSLNEQQRKSGADLPVLELSVAAGDTSAVPVTPAPLWRDNGELLKPVPQDNRKIIRNADVSLEVESYDATYTKLAELAAAEKGFVASANTQKLANGKIQATVVVRVPPDRFEAVIARFKELGSIRHQNIGSEDVTKAYIDLESRLASKQILASRLSKLLAEGKGTVKELMEVEVQLGATNEAIESLKGELKYYDNRIGLSTITLQIAEKDLGQPFEYVQTLQANLALTVRDPDEAYAKAQKEIVDAGGQVVDSRMNRQSDGSSTGTIRGRVDADRFQALRDALKKLGVATNDTVNQQKTAHGGREGLPKADAPLRKEQAVLDLSVSSPPIFVTRRSQLVVETAEVESAYQNSRKSVEGLSGKIVDGSLTGRGDRMVAVLKIQADADKFAALMESLKTAGKVKTAGVSSVLPTAAADGGTALLRERAEIEFTLVSPPQLIADENGLGKSIRDTFANSWAGVLWSVEKLFVGISLAGPWLLFLGAGVAAWRRARRKKAPAGP